MKKFVITTAIALALSTSAYAQVSASGIAERAEAGSLVASDLVGAEVYAATSVGAYEPGMEADWPTVGPVTDIVTSGDAIEAVIVNVGIFLGTGDKEVSVPYSDLEFVAAGPDQVFVVADLSAETLASAPAISAPSVVDEVVDGAQDTAEAVSEGAADTAEATGDMAEQAVDATEDMAADAADATADATQDAAAATENAAEETAEVVDDTAEAAAAETSELMSDAEQAAADTAGATENVVDDAATETQQAGEAIAEETAEAADDAGSMINDGIAAAGAALSDAGDTIATEANELADSAGEAVQDMVTATEEAADEVMAPDETAQVTALTEAELVDATLYTADGDELGEISAVTADGAVVNYGGFLGLGERQVLVPMEQLSLSADARVMVSLDQAALDALPDYEAN